MKSGLEFTKWASHQVLMPLLDESILYPVAEVQCAIRALLYLTGSYNDHTDSAEKQWQWAKSPSEPITPVKISQCLSMLPTFRSIPNIRLKTILKLRSLKTLNINRNKEENSSRLSSPSSLLHPSMWTWLITQSQYPVLVFSLYLLILLTSQLASYPPLMSSMILHSCKHNKLKIINLFFSSFFLGLTKSPFKHMSSSTPR